MNPHSLLALVGVAGVAGLRVVADAEVAEVAEAHTGARATALLKSTWRTKMPSLLSKKARTQIVWQL